MKPFHAISLAYSAPEAAVPSTTCSLFLPNRVSSSSLLSKNLLCPYELIIGNRAMDEDVFSLLSLGIES